jgi:hypothetical protein
VDTFALIATTLMVMTWPISVFKVLQCHQLLLSKLKYIGLLAIPLLFLIVVLVFFGGIGVNFAVFWSILISSLLNWIYILRVAPYLPKR